MEDSRDASRPETEKAGTAAGIVFDPAAGNPYLEGYDVPDPDSVEEPEPPAVPNPVSPAQMHPRENWIARYGPVVLLVTLAALAFGIRDCGGAQFASQSLDSAAPSLVWLQSLEPAGKGVR